MTLIEAVNSGKLFKRASSDKPYYTENSFYFLTTEDFLATDWELKPEPRVWTLSKVNGKITVSGDDLGVDEVITINEETGLET